MSDEPASPVVPEVPSESAQPEITTADPADGSPLTVFEAATSPPVGPEMLVEGLRHLRERIPGYVQLSVADQRSMMRAAFLDPEFIDSGIAAGLHWDEVKAIVGSSGEELREENEEIARWDEAIRDWRVILQGMEDANRARRHRLGVKILLLYATLKLTIDNPARGHLRPYLEIMKRSYLKKRKKAAKPDPKDEGTEPAE